jgi:hypothetical protein
MKRLLALALALASVVQAQTYYEKSTVPPKSQFYVTSYGAKCNGTAKDTTGIRAAAAAITAAGGGEMVLPSATCVLDNTVTLSSNTTVSGYGGTLSVPFSGWQGALAQQAFILAASASNVTIRGVNFQYDNSASGNCEMIQLFSTNSHVLLTDNTANWCGDFVANIGASDVIITNNRVYNAQNSCFDSWHGAQNVVIASNICTTTRSATTGVFFTGYHNPGPTGDLNKGMTVVGNIFTIGGSASVGIEVNGNPGVSGTGDCTSGTSTDDRGVIADNVFYGPSGLAGYGILIRFCANNWDVHDNQIYSDGTVQNDPAIAAYTIGTNVHIHHNQVYNWDNENAGSTRGQFANSTVGGSITFNECYSCGATLIGLTDATTMIVGNDTGTGILSIPASASYPAIVSSGAISVGADWQLKWTGRGILTSPGTANIHLGDVNSATPVDQILSSQGSRNGTDVDVAGANLTLASGAGTGAATGSVMNLSTPEPTTTGSTGQTATSRLRLSSGEMRIPSDEKFDWNARDILTSPAAGKLQMGDADAASPVNQTLQVQSSRGGTDSDTAGANLIVQSGLGTGSATGSTVIVKTPNPGSTGTTAETAVNALSMSATAISIGNATSNPTLTFLGSGALSGTPLTNYLASPAAIGGTVAAAVTGTTVAATTKYTKGVTVLCSFAAASPTTHTGDTVETNLAICTLPQSVVPSQSLLRVTVNWYRSATTTNNVTFRIRDSSVSGTISAGNAYSNSITTSGAVQSVNTVLLWATATNAQLSPAGAGSLLTTTSASAPSTSGNQDRSAAATYLNFSCQNVTSSGDTCGIYAYTVELLAP